MLVIVDRLSVMASHKVVTASHDVKHSLELTVAEGDTGIVRDYLRAIESRGVELAAAAEIAKTSVRTLSRWKQLDKQNKPQSIDRVSRSAINAYLHRNAPQDQKIVALSMIAELRAMLDELEVRLAPATGPDHDLGQAAFDSVDAGAEALDPTPAKSKAAGGAPGTGRPSSKRVRRSREE